MLQSDWSECCNCGISALINDPLRFIVIAIVEWLKNVLERFHDKHLRVTGWAGWSIRDTYMYMYIYFVIGIEKFNAMNWLDFSVTFLL